MNTIERIKLEIRENEAQQMANCLDPEVSPLRVILFHRRKEFLQSYLDHEIKRAERLRERRRILISHFTLSRSYVMRLTTMFS